MAKRYPIVYDKTNHRYEELPATDYIDPGLDAIPGLNSTGVGISGSQAVTFTSSGGNLEISLAQATAATFAACYGFTAESIADGDSGNVQIENRLTGFAGLTQGDTYYLSKTPGAITNNTSAFLDGDFIQKVGYALSATELYIEIEEPIKIRV